MGRQEVAEVAHHSTTSRTSLAAVVVTAALGIPACTAPIDGEEAQAAARLADAIARELAAPDVIDGLERGDLHPETIAAAAPLPEGVAGADVLDASVSIQVDGAGTVTAGIDAAVAVTFTARDEAVCVLTAATSAGKSDAAADPSISLDDCTQEARDELRTPMQGAQQLFDPAT